MATFAKEKTRRLMHHLLYGVLFVGISYLTSLFPSLFMQEYSNIAPFTSIASADDPNAPTGGSYSDGVMWSSSDCSGGMGCSGCNGGAESDNG